MVVYAAQIIGFSWREKMEPVCKSVLHTGSTFFVDKIVVFLLFFCIKALRLSALFFADTRNMSVQMVFVIRKNFNFVVSKKETIMAENIRNPQSAKIRNHFISSNSVITKMRQT